MNGSVSQYYNDAVQAAENAGVPPQLFTDLINNESDWNPNAVSSTGAIGIAQVLPTTAANPGYGVAPFDPNNPSSALSGAAQYIAALQKEFGSWGAAVNAYNTGNPNEPNNYGAAVNNDANAADNGITPINNGGWTWAGVFNDLFGTSVDGAGPGGSVNASGPLPNVGNNLTGAASSAVKGVETWIKGIGLEIIVAIFVVVLVTVGFISMITHKSPGEVIKSGATAIS